tara:strand:+ start:321 stop:548 length:228 start_codon:yes stop_codon:yes gene_type:complete
MPYIYEIGHRVFAVILREVHWAFAIHPLYPRRIMLIEMIIGLAEAMSLDLTILVPTTVDIAHLSVPCREKYPDLL